MDTLYTATLTPGKVWEGRSMGEGGSSIIFKEKFFHAGLVKTIMILVLQEDPLFPKIKSVSMAVTCALKINIIKNSLMQE